MNGTFTTAGGTPILGANIWAREISTGKVYSVVSDFLTQGNGYFRLYLPAGTYTLNAESIATNFTGGSSVGPYSESRRAAPRSRRRIRSRRSRWAADSAQPIVITAGCLATATFRLDGTGSVSGNCAGSTPTSTTTTLTSSGSPATVGTTVTFTATVAGTHRPARVNFKDGGTTITGCGTVALSGAGNSTTAACSTSSLAVGVHSIVANYSGDAGNAASTSTALSQVINPAGGSSNVALASAGRGGLGVEHATRGYPLVTVNDNERAGVNWGNGGGGWADATANAYPDWVQINFNGSKTHRPGGGLYGAGQLHQPGRAHRQHDLLPVWHHGLHGAGLEWFGLGDRWPRSPATTWSSARVTFAAFTTDRIRINVTNALVSLLAHHRDRGLGRWRRRACRRPRRR